MYRLMVGAVGVLCACALIVAGCGSAETTTTTYLAGRTVTTTTVPPSTETTEAASSDATIPATAATNTWVKLNPSGMPSRRANPSMVYDSRTGRVLMFGGMTGASYLNETWAYDPHANTWTNLHPSGTLPSGRAYQSMAYDSDTGLVIMFGGMNDNGVDGLPNDTWAYDPHANTWTNLHPSGTLPPGRAYHSMIYDPSVHRVIMFGGDGLGMAFFNDTWAYDPAANTWTELSPSGSLPSARAWQSMVYVPSTHQAIMFGGGERFDLVNDTWAYDPAANIWTELSPSGSLPSARANQLMAYDSDTGKVIMFGGNDSFIDDLLNDIWVYDPVANTWSDLHPSVSPPSGRDGYWMAYDPSMGEVIMFEGHSAMGDGGPNDIWAYIP
jgi:N-acetylneuraminic acid mutarotase